MHTFSLCLLYKVLNFRLANILHVSNIDVKIIWQIVKEVRKSFQAKNLKLDCQGDMSQWIEPNPILSDDHIIDNVENVQEKLKIQPKITTIDNIAQSTLDIAANMFTYLNSCPPKYLKMIDFYANILKNPSTKKILLAFLSITETATGVIEVSSKEILRKIMEKLDLVNYKNIDTITEEENNNNISAVCKFEDSISDECKNVLDVLGSIFICLNRQEK